MNTRNKAEARPAPSPSRFWEVAILKPDGQLVEVVKTGLDRCQAQIRADRINEIAARGAGKGLPRRIPAAPSTEEVSR